MNNTYSVSAYFWGKNSSEFLFHLSYPIIQTSIMYYIVGLSQTSDDKIIVLSKNCFFVCLFTIILLVGIGMATYFCSISFGLFFSVILPKPELAMSLSPMIMVPFMLFGGFFVNQNNVPYYFYPIQYISMFKYGFQAAVQVFLQIMFIFLEFHLFRTSLETQFIIVMRAKKKSVTLSKQEITDKIYGKAV